MFWREIYKSANAQIFPHYDSAEMLLRKRNSDRYREPQQRCCRRIWRPWSFWQSCVVTCFYSVYDWHWRCCAFGVTSCGFIDSTFALLLKIHFGFRGSFLRFHSMAAQGRRTAQDKQLVHELLGNGDPRAPPWDLTSLVLSFTPGSVE